MAIVFVAGPLSGLLAQPLVGVWSDGCKSKFGRRRPFIFGGVVISSLSVCLLGWAKEVAAWFATSGGETVCLSLFIGSFVEQIDVTDLLLPHHLAQELVDLLRNPLGLPHVSLEHQTVLLPSLTGFCFFASRSQ